MKTVIPTIILVIFTGAWSAVSCCCGFTCNGLRGSSAGRRADNDGCCRDKRSENDGCSHALASDGCTCLKKMAFDLVIVASDEFLPRNTTHYPAFSPIRQRLAFAADLRLSILPDGPAGGPPGPPGHVDLVVLRI